MRLRLFPVRYLLFALVLIAAGCERHEGLSLTAEVDEPSYRRAKELIRQGRNQEALNEFQKVLEKRGLENSPESHLELGLLFQLHIHDPISAIYHYRKYREIKPNSTQAPLVAQRIDAATREFALTVKAPQPDNQLGGSDMTDVLQRLQQDNEQLKSELAMARANLSELRSKLAIGQPVNSSSTPGSIPQTGRPAGNTLANPSPLTAISSETPVPPSSPLSRPAPATATNANSTVARPPASAPAPTPATGAGRKHVVVKGDTLMNLAQHYYGNRSRYHDIFNANRDVLKSEADVRIGMELKIP